MTKRRSTSTLLAGAMLAGCAATPSADDPAATIALKDMGSFHVGGRIATVSGKPVREELFAPGGVPAKVDPNGSYQVEQMYVQWFQPAHERARVPLLLWHGGGMTGANYETTPDGRPGWLNFFIRQGWTVYNGDAVERGRAGWAMYPDIATTSPVFLTKENPFERFRIGAGPGSYNDDPAKRRVLPGNQFPVEAYDAFTRQVVPRWTSSDDATIAAYTALVDKVCPCAIVVHSQSGSFGYRVAQARPDKVRALVLVEPAGVGDIARVAALKGVPTLSIYGDFIAQDARWPAIRANNLKFQDAIRAAGGRADLIDLPKIGIRGNSHMMMMDRNNLEVAGVIQRWLADQGLMKGVVGR